MRVLGARPQAHATPRCRPAGAPGALVGRGAADGYHPQRVDPVARIETRFAGETRIDDRGDALDGEGALRHVGRQDDLTPRSTPDGRCCASNGRSPWRGTTARSRVAALARWPPRRADLGGAGQENEHVAAVIRRVCQDALQRMHHARGERPIIAVST